MTVDRGPRSLIYEPSGLWFTSETDSLAGAFEPQPAERRDLSLEEWQERPPTTPIVEQRNRQIAPIADRRRRHRADQQITGNAPGISRRIRQAQNPAVG